MYIDVKTDLTWITRKPVLLPSAWDPSTDGHYLPGEWVLVDANNRVARVTPDPITHMNVYPVITGSERMDVRFVDGCTVLYGIYEAETDNYTGTPAIHAPLTVEGDGATPERGRLRVAVSGEIVIGWVTKAAVSGVNDLIFMKAHGWGHVA